MRCHCFQGATSDARLRQILHLVGLSIVLIPCPPSEMQSQWCFFSGTAALVISSMVYVMGLNCELVTVETYKDGHDSRILSSWAFFSGASITLAALMVLEIALVRYGSIRVLKRRQALTMTHEYLDDELPDPAKVREWIPKRARAMVLLGLTVNLIGFLAVAFSLLERVAPRPPLLVVSESPISVRWPAIFQPQAAVWDPGKQRMAVSNKLGDVLLVPFAGEGAFQAVPLSGNEVVQCHGGRIRHLELAGEEATFGDGVVWTGKEGVLEFLQGGLVACGETSVWFGPRENCLVSFVVSVVEMSCAHFIQIGDVVQGGVGTWSKVQSFICFKHDFSLSLF